jgi:tetraprenyl-beta-curcumene synthase
MGPSARRRLALAAAFVRAAILYWTTVFPLVRTEVSHWRHRARSIPDARLRRVALDTLDDERGNLEGAAAFATFVPASARPHVVRATVAFQAIYDYVDSLVETPAIDPVANGRALHQALDAAVTQQTGHPDYYAYFPYQDDGGYLAELVDACRDALQRLPAHALIEGCARRAVARMVDYQAFIHAPRTAAAVHDFRTWALAATPLGLPLRWWETAAAAASSLLVFALVADAARPDLPHLADGALEAAYFPWVGALHVLLDSLIDQRDDEAAGHPSLVGHYEDDAETAVRMSWIARSARAEVEALDRPAPHLLLLVGMACFYLSADVADDPRARLATRRISTALGPLAVPTLAVLCARRRAAAAAAHLDRRRRRPSSRPTGNDR